MSVTTNAQPPKSVFDQYETRLRQMKEAEELMVAKQPEVHAYKKQLDSYIPRYQHLLSKSVAEPTSFLPVEQVWRRLWWEPVDPGEALDLHFTKAAEKLREDSEHLFACLQKVITKRLRLLQTWQEYIEEVNFRTHLLDTLETRMEAFESHLILAETQTQQSRQLIPPPLPNAREVVQELSETHVLEEETQSELPAQMLHESAANPPESNQTSRDNREYPRINLGMIVQFGESHHSFYTGFSENISSGGLFIATYDLEPKIGERFKVSMSLPGGQTIETLGEVAWIREYSSKAPDFAPGFGCRLIDLSPEDQNAINSCIAKRGSMFIA